MSNVVQNSCSGRMIGYVEVVDPVPLTLYVFNEKLNVSEDPQWNTATVGEITSPFSLLKLPLGM